MRSYYACLDTATAEEWKRKARENSRRRRQEESYRQKERSYYREWYLKNGRKRRDNYSEVILEWQQEHPDRVMAMKSLQYAIKTGKIAKPVSCQDCGRITHLSGHHTDYSKPLKVVWLCSSCHKLRHSPVRG